MPKPTRSPRSPRSLAGKIPRQQALSQQLPLLILCFGLGCFLTLTLPNLAQAQGDPPTLPKDDRALSHLLPPPQAHPLPPSLGASHPIPLGVGGLGAKAAGTMTLADQGGDDQGGNYQDGNYQGDYFDQIQPSPLGYLVWSQFPIRVYGEAPSLEDGSAEAQRQQAWGATLDRGLAAWQPYLPLVRTTDPTEADITVLRSRPPLQRRGDGGLDRARAAETRYRFRLVPQAEGPPQIQPQFTLYLPLGQPPAQLATTVRHELGHALGLWGHSPQPQDVMYAQQTPSPAAISRRDIQTLHRVYQQPTQVGWAVVDGD